ncbi:MAG: SDR family NAD(P)-dependent oxidoreductase [Alphaproteobacteria bacterium]|nr:SDR family NAD(P)-dependent oxidoreductase [Alphaproteobacteria bacterium]
MNSVVITGVSSGIGRGAVEFLVGKGFHVFGSVRKQSDADALLKAFPQNFTPLIFDVTDEAGVRAGSDTVRAALGGRTLRGLVNNAGIALPGPVLHQPLKEYRQQIEVNLIGAFTVSQAFSPLLGADRTLQGLPGRIVNITSLGGKIGSPFLSGYCSAKHGLEGLSESLRRELMLYGIDVIIIGPGAVKTPIWDKAEALDTTAYARTDYGPAMVKLSEFMAGGARDGLDVARVGELIHRALTVRRPRVRYALAPDMFFDWIVPRVLPRRWIDRFFAQRLGLTRLRP